MCNQSQSGVDLPGRHIGIGPSYHMINMMFYSASKFEQPGGAASHKILQGPVPIIRICSQHNQQSSEQQLAVHQITWACYCGSWTRGCAAGVVPAASVGTAAVTVAAVRTSPLASLWSFVAGAVAGTRSSDTADRLAPRVPWKGMVPPEPLSAGPGDGERCKK